MADVKFSELTSLAASDVAAADIFAVVDTSASTSKKLTVDNLFGAIPVNIAVTDTTDSSSNTTGSITTTGGTVSFPEAPVDCEDLDQDNVCDDVDDCGIGYPSIRAVKCSNA